MGEKEISIDIKRPIPWVLLSILLLVLFAELQLSFSSPIAFGDEGFYVHMGRWMAENREYPVWNPLYGTKLTQVGNFKAPLLTLIEGGLFLVFGFNELIAKFLFPFIGFLTALSVYVLAKKLFSEKVGFFAAILTVTVSSFITYSIIFYVEIFSAFIFIAGGLLMMLHASTKQMRYLLLAGIFLGFGLLTKIPNYASVLFVFLVGLYEVIESRKITIDIIKRYGLLIAITFLVSFTFFLRNYRYYDIFSCEITFGRPSNCVIGFDYTPTNNLQGSAESGGTSISLIKFGILQYLDFSFGSIIWFIPLLFLCGLVITFTKGGRNNILLLLLLLTIIPIIYKTLSSRVEETSRFTVGAIPVVAIFCGMYLEKLTDFVKRFHMILEIVAVAIVIFIAFLNFGIPAIGQALGYYGKLPSLRYVKGFVGSFFVTCDWVKQNLPKDAVILSFHTHPTVYNCERDAYWTTPDRPDILSGNLNVSLPRLKAHGYTHIFVQMFAVSPGFLDSTYPLGFVEMLDQNPQYFKEVFNNGDSVSSCKEKLNSGQGCDGGIIYEINYTGAS